MELLFYPDYGTMARKWTCEHIVIGKFSANIKTVQWMVACFINLTQINCVWDCGQKLKDQIKVVFKTNEREIFSAYFRVTTQNLS